MHFATPISACPATPSRADLTLSFFSSFSAEPLFFFCQTFDDRHFVFYTLLAGILDPLFGQSVLPFDIPSRKKRFLPQCCGHVPSPGSAR